MTMLDKSLDIKLLFELAYCLHYWISKEEFTPAIPYKVKTSLLIRYYIYDRCLYLCLD